MAVVAAETARLRQRNMEHILAMIYEGISMRLIRRHGLDAPLLTDDARAVLVRAVMERRKKARVSRPENLATRINIASVLNARALDLAISDSQENAKPNQAFRQPSQRVTDPEELQRTIETIRRRVADYFQMAKLRDSDLKIHSHRQVFAFPRQVAMYVVRQLTGASLQEIGRQFGGRHHTTVLHSIKKVEEMLQSDILLNQIVRQLLERGDS
jgi:chromosomal replication initiation ATPase DnaA